jgi:hypothetical protein
MTSKFTSLWYAAVLAISITVPLFAQEANVLGLPAIPQPKPGSAPTTGTTKPGSGASAAKGVSQPSVNRDAISGELGLQHSAREGVGRLIVTTRTVFTTAGARSVAVDSGKLVQRELANACGKQCQPQKMIAPKILSSGQLEFELVFAPLYQNLNQAQFLAAIQGRPLNLTPAQLQAPAVAPIQVQVQSTAATSSTMVGSNTTSQ